MKKIITTLLFCLPLLHVVAQIPEGTYREGNDSIVLKGQYAKFSLKGFTGLTITQVGEGGYELEGDILSIRTDSYSGHKSASRLHPAKLKDSCMVMVVGINGYRLPTILVEARTKSGKLLEGKVTDQEGKVYFKVSDKIASITVQEMGYHTHKIDFEAGKDYLVQLAENDVIEEREVLFLYRLIDDETLSLLMLSDDFKVKKNRDGEIKKLLKKAKRSNRLAKRLKKEYVPYERKF